MVKLWLAATLPLAVACHNGDEHGLTKLGTDPLVGCWRAPSGETLDVKDGTYTGPPGWTGASWSRETKDLISVHDPILGTKTIQTDFSSDASELTLSFTSTGSSEAGVEAIVSERLGFTRVAEDAGGCP